MKKLTLLILSAFLMLSVIPSQSKATTDTGTARTDMISTETASGTDQLSKIKSIDFTPLSTSENKEALKEANPLVNDQGRHNGRFNNRRNRDVDLTLKTDQGYRHNHNGIYIGVGGVLVLILILILVL